MRLPRVLVALALVGLIASGGKVWADYAIKDGNGAAQTILAFVCSTTKICPAQVMIDSTGAEKGTNSNPVRTDPVGTTSQPVKLQDGAGNAITSQTRGSQQPISVQILDGSGNQVTSFGGAGGTASNFGSAFPTPGTAVGFSDGTNMVSGRVVASGADAISNSTPSLIGGAFGYFYNGTTWDRARGDTTNGLWVNVKSSVLPNGAATSANQTNKSQLTQLTDGTNAATTYTTYGTAPSGNVPGVNAFVTNSNANGAASVSNSSPVTPSNQPVGGANFANTQVSVGSTATQIVAARTGVAGTGRISATVCNTSTVAVYLGGSGVTTSTGQYLAGVAGACATFNTTAAIYGIVASGTETVGATEVY